MATVEWKGKKSVAEALMRGHAVGEQLTIFENLRNRDVVDGDGWVPVKLRNMLRCLRRWENE